MLLLLLLYILNFLEGVQSFLQEMFPLVTHLSNLQHMHDSSFSENLLLCIDPIFLWHSIYTYLNPATPTHILLNPTHNYVTCNWWQTDWLTFFLHLQEMAVSV